MTASEMIAKLKADRRADIAQQKREAEELAAEVARENACRLDAAIAAALGKHAVAALASCFLSASDGPKIDRRPTKEVAFGFPECPTTVTLRLIGSSPRADGAIYWNEASSATDHEYATWIVEGMEEGFDRLDDALIAAEVPASAAA